MEGSAFDEKVLTIYQSARININGNEPVIVLKRLELRDGNEIVEITSSAWQGLALRGTMPGADGRITFTEVRLLSSHVHGWNEFVLDISGDAFFLASGDVIGLLRVRGEIERIQISSGKIRLKSSRYTGAAALTSLRNRRERILALLEWMDTVKEQNSFKDPREFENYWKPILFPELVSKERQPPGYTTENAVWVRRDSIRWNKTYTENTFPEELRELRNSGGLIRDWEEALPWIYIEYSWNSIISSLNDINLIKIR